MQDFACIDSCEVAQRRTVTLTIGSITFETVICALAVVNCDSSCETCAHFNTFCTQCSTGYLAFGHCVSDCEIIKSLDKTSYGNRVVRYEVGATNKQCIIDTACPSDKAIVKNTVDGALYC
jgi:hypothetical protein